MELKIFASNWLLLIWLLLIGPISCPIWIYTSLEVVSYMVGKILVYEFHSLIEEMGLEFSSSLSSAR